MDRPRIDVPNGVHERTAGASVSGHPVCDRGTRSLVGGFALPLRVWIGDSVEFAQGRFSVLGLGIPETPGSDSHPIDTKDGGMLFTFLLEKRKDCLVSEARFS
jgi:hypothetical protein